MKEKHPHVSEESEGSRIVSWLVVILVAVATVLAFLRHLMAATVILSVTAIALGVLRLLLGKRSLWKVRSQAFDAFICIALGLGLLVTYFSIGLLV